MAVINDMESLYNQSCFFCGGLIFRTPACKITGEAGVLILHSVCVQKMQEILAQDQKALNIHFKTNP